jgi:hypothetical protein
MIVTLRRLLAAAAETVRVRPLVTLGRVALWAAVGLVFVRGAVSLLPEANAEPRTARAVVAAPVFPSGPAMAFASRFATDYLSFADGEDRHGRLAQYLADGVDISAEVAGTQQVLQALPVGVDVKSPRLAVVTVAAAVGRGVWMHLAVPVAADASGSLAVAGSPALVAAPTRAVVPTPEPAESDSGTATQVTPALEAFFRAYALGDAAGLAYYLPPGRSLNGLGGAVAFGGLTGVRVGPGPGPREASATVTWTAGSASLAQTYQLRLVESGGRFYVDDIGPATPDPTKEKNNDR